MISIYWPGKAVPTWLVKVSFDNQSSRLRRFHHGGFGFIVSRSGEYHAIGLWGSCFYVEGAVSVTFEWQGKGVVYHELGYGIRKLLRKAFGGAR
jgi:hypothetical protein